MKVYWGRKVGMTQVKVGGKLSAVTVLQVMPSFVVAKKTAEKDGYASDVLAVGSKKRANRSILGLTKKAGVDLVPSFVAEVRDSSFDAAVGSQVTELLLEGDCVSIQSVSKGKGFQGPIKKLGFGRGPETHGSNTHRRMGSIGMREWPGEVRKGHPMPGRMGGQLKTVRGLKVVKVVGDLVALSGSVPGANKTVIKVIKK